MTIIKNFICTAFAIVLMASPVLAQETAAPNSVGKPSTAAAIHILIVPNADNLANPQMGDQLKFESVITNSGTTPIHGLVAWVSLVQIDPGQEQPVDLEDWSAHKAEVAKVIEPGKSVQAIWPFRLIKSGTYRVVVSAASREDPLLVSSEMLTFTVAQKPVVESARVIPVAAGIPLLLILALLYRRRRGGMG
jgi:hypothetical protein